MSIDYSIEEILPYLERMKKTFGTDFEKKVENDFLFFQKYFKPSLEMKSESLITNLIQNLKINQSEMNISLTDELKNQPIKINELNSPSDSDLQSKMIYCYFAYKTKPGIIDFSRLSFENTILSKRNLKEIISTNKLTWDDPRIPTLKGIIRKGLNVEALKEYILMQGVAQKTSIFSWDKLWSINKKVIDDLSGRYFCIEEENLVELELMIDSDLPPKQVLLNRKNPELGTKTLYFGKTIYLDRRDVNLVKDSEFTLMYFSTAVIKDNKILLTDSDVRKCKNKIHWVSKINSVRVKLIYFDDLLKDDVFNAESKQEVWAVGEESLLSVKTGSTLQMERIGFFYVDSKGIYHSVPFTVQARKY